MPSVRAYNLQVTIERYPKRMPIYEYRANSERHCEFCSGGFEIIQKIADPRLSQCPKCKAPVARQLSAPSIGKAGPSLDRANIEKHGFTQYRRSGQGVYEKTAGKGPDVLKDD
jgi:putative FmdB family regulatory protein